MGEDQEIRRRVQEGINTEVYGGAVGGGFTEHDPVGFYVIEIIEH